MNVILEEARPWDEGQREHAIRKGLGRNALEPRRPRPCGRP